ncbi:damage-inducible protein DinB [Niabella ginsenosidivorans]|uniref:Damage-inducible protein DinB n=1 Tax=Niabella ginsenosidivorans TaxID=1176587 RepID=A0A1A9IA01_9BACT|nr:DinB family protein [Niabella ginsenosidivorans]ANH83501.1 damage-inducible protein DinB [Niabella ginsenosidivorans]
MNKVEVFQRDFEKEIVITRKFLAIVPEDKFDWKPHPKSMTLRQLATHIAELPSWISMALNTDGLDFATMDYKPTPINDTKSLMELFEKSVVDGRKNLAKATDEALDEPWTLREGEKIYSTDPKADVIRMSLSQIIHHRAQLGVFLRLLDIPIPGSYGPSADEQF